MLTSKEEIAQWLNNYFVHNYFIYDDLTVDVNGDIDLFRLDLIELPIQFGFIRGDFSLRGNKLTSLKGCPYEVTGVFDCSFNQLTSLEFCPSKVGKDFLAFHNQLTSLKYSPKTVNGSFHFNKNNVTSLEHITPIIGKNLNGEENQLTNLSHFPSVGENIYLSNNKITSLKGIQSHIDGNFQINSNPLKNFDDMPCHINGEFYCLNIPFPFDNFNYQDIYIADEIKLTHHQDDASFLDNLARYIDHVSFDEKNLYIHYSDLQSYFLKKQLQENLTQHLEEKNNISQRKI